MTWILLAVVGLATAGLLVLGVLSVRVWAGVRGLAKQVDAASLAIASAADELSAAARR
ncbi:hypothetical protein [Kitasatospora viridis]|uniref:Uncharacterized protein n=1 Tax=Kitasatospora viridis TaxID=281105 RepID=A0A561UNI9_9ACTN|nr:hypothetical protein [Kitasatospora viridis]TWG00938.1 hypothetical protein FHX73_114819 [Kitasatospora viridis]